MKFGNMVFDKTKSVFGIDVDDFNTIVELGVFDTMIDVIFGGFFTGTSRGTVTIYNHSLRKGSQSQLAGDKAKSHGVQRRNGGVVDDDVLGMIKMFDELGFDFGEFQTGRSVIIEMMK